MEASNESPVPPTETFWERSKLHVKVYPEYMLPKITAAALVGVLVGGWKLLIFRLVSS